MIADSLTNLALERLRLDYEEKLIWQEAKNSIAKKLLKEKIRESNLRVQGKMADLEKEETAMLNLLEDSKELEERFGAVISSMTESLVLIDKKYRIVLMNKTAERVLGVLLYDALGMDLQEIIKVFRGNEVLSKKEMPVYKVLETGEAVFINLRDDIYYAASSGKKFPVSVGIAPLKGDGVTGAVMVFRDITPEKNLDEARTSFVSLASHQLRTPLTAIQWSLELLMGKETGTLTDMQRQFATDAYEGTGKLVETINLLLSLARVESGSVQINPSPVAVVDCIRAIAAELSQLVAQKELTLTVHEPASPIPPIMLDMPMLREVVINILFNAIRYSNAHGAVDVTFEAGDSLITVSVKDGGIGIPNSQHSRIFEKFFRADNAIHKTAEGTGLGLNLAKTLITLWHGTIWFESEEGKGTTFYFTIPYEGMKEKREGKPIVV